MPRGRPKKEKEDLSQSQVWDVIEFARSIGQIWQNVYSPDMVNARMKDINMNPLAATKEKIETALLDPKNHELELKGFNEYFELNNMIFKRMTDYISFMPSFDYTITCTNAYSLDDYKSKQYQKDLNAVYGFLDKFDVRREFKKVMKQLIRQETYYSVLRLDGKKYTFQELPNRYCKLTSKSEWGYLFDINMQFFLQPGVSLDFFPPIFKKMFKEVFKGDVQKYNPTADLDKRTGSYVHWVQTSIENDFWAWKLTPEIATEVPYLAPLFSDVVLAPYVRNLQSNAWMISASKIAVGLIPLLKDNKSGNVRDMFGISPEVLGKFMGLLKNAIGDVIKLGAGPFEKIETLDFSTTNANMLEDYNKNMSASSGINSRLIYGVEKPNAIETQASIAVDEYIHLVVYNQFNLFMDYYLNKFTKKYSFKLKFEGSEFPSNKKERFERAMTCLDKGIVLPQKIAAALNMDIADFQRQLDMARAEDWVNKLTPIVTAYTNTMNKGGRPQSSDNELSDAGTQTRDDGGNITKGGDI